jgi:YkoY family integral membrane protein
MLSSALPDIFLIAWYIGVLAMLEGLLSADNALVLALMVRHLSKREQRRVLFYGIWGAVAFRVIALLLSAILLRFWIFKVLGGLYLLYLASSHFLSAREDPVEVSGVEGPGQGARSRRALRGFWGTVTAVTMADIAFSIDSILAAVAMADDFPARFGPNGKLFIVFVGGVLGIITMRFVVRYFLILLDRFPGLAEGAYWLVAWIGLKLLISGFHTAEYLSFHIPEWLFWSVMVLIAAVSLVIKPGGKAGGGGVSESLDLIDSAEEPNPDGPADGAGAAGGPDLLGSEPEGNSAPEQASGQRSRYGDGL